MINIILIYNYQCMFYQRITLKIIILKLFFWMLYKFSLESKIWEKCPPYCTKTTKNDLKMLKMALKTKKNFFS